MGEDYETFGGERPCISTETQTIMEGVIGKDLNTTTVDRQFGHNWAHLVDPPSHDIKRSIQTSTLAVPFKTMTTVNI